MQYDRDQQYQIHRPHQVTVNPVRRSIGTDILRLCHHHIEMDGAQKEHNEPCRDLNIPEVRIVMVQQSFVFGIALVLPVGRGEFSYRHACMQYKQ